MQPMFKTQSWKEHLDVTIINGHTHICKQHHGNEYLEGRLHRFSCLLLESHSFSNLCTFRKWAMVACSGPEGDDVFDNAIGCAFRNWTLYA